jgi:uncharacterized membrane protein
VAGGAGPGLPSEGNRLAAADLAAPTSPRWAPALPFHGLYRVGLTALALNPRPDRPAAALGRGARVVAVTHGTCDMTNLATLKGYTLAIPLIDVAWGDLDSACASCTAWKAFQGRGRPAD